MVVASLSQILLKKSAAKTYSSVIREYLNPYVIAGYGMMVLSTLLTVGGLHDHAKNVRLQRMCPGTNTFRMKGSC